MSLDQLRPHVPMARQKRYWADVFIEGCWKGLGLILVGTAWAALVVLLGVWRTGP